MKLHYLKYFCVLAEELHFGRAANRLSITQPPLSAAIKALEDELGEQLLLRNTKAVQLTPAGAAFLSESRQILERVTREASVVKAIGSGMSGRVDVGMSPGLIYRDVPRIVAKFHEEMPGVVVELHEMLVEEQLENLMQGQLHAGFVFGSAAPQQLKSVPLKDDEYVLCVPKGHPKANKSRIDLRDMADDQFVMFARETGSANQDIILANFNRAGINPRTQHQARSWLSMMGMVSQGCGVALVPTSMARAEMGGVKLIPLSEHYIRVPAVLVWNPALVTPALEKFLESAIRTISAS
jgi:DNA-binding transcriptional LysR family regulator